MSNNLGKILKHRRVMVPLTLEKLSAMSGVSPSHLGRIERGERFPSARVLRRIAKPLGFGEDELFILAGYLSPQPPGVVEASVEYFGGQVDSYVADVLAREPVEVQQAVIAILTVLKSIAPSLSKK